MKVNSTRSIIFVGTGGVGKTTTSAAYGLYLARQNKRVLVLTIDPSQRLKDTLGLKDDGEITEVPIGRPQGSLFGCVLNSKKVFDEFILRAARKEERIKKILNNRLYIQLSTTLSGSQEFTSLERFYQLTQSKDYDYVILDTPPAQHAIDFLTAPQRLSHLFNEGVARWFKNPESGQSGIFQTLFQFGTKRVLKALELLTGSQFMKELSEFFLSLDTWQEQLQNRIDQVQTLLTESSNQFYLVTSFDEAKFSEALSLMVSLKKGGYHLSRVIANRAYPQWLSDLPQNLEGPPALLIQKIKTYYDQQQVQLEAFRKKSGAEVKFDLIPEFEESLSQLNDLEMVLPHFSAEIT